jgi:hypothetical protein
MPIERKSRPRTSSPAPRRRRRPDHEDRDVSEFDALSAFESARGDLTTIEALVSIASEKLEWLGGGRTAEQRRNASRLFVLVDAAARAATEALDRSAEQQRQLDALMAAKRARRAGR